MIVISEAVLDQFRGTRRCELCFVTRHCFPHHVWARGMGGGTRLDVDCNLIAVCHGCHMDIHEGIIGRGEVVGAVSRRMKISAAEIEQRVWDLRRAPK